MQVRVLAVDFFRIDAERSFPLADCEASPKWHGGDHNLHGVDIDSSQRRKESQTKIPGTGFSIFPFHLPCRARRQRIRCIKSGSIHG
jgi:hypothetical protein